MNGIETNIETEESKTQACYCEVIKKMWGSVQEMKNLIKKKKKKKPLPRQKNLLALVSMNGLFEIKKRKIDERNGVKAVKLS